MQEQLKPSYSFAAVSSSILGPRQLQCTVVNVVDLSWGGDQPHGDDCVPATLSLLFTCYLQSSEQSCLAGDVILAVRFGVQTFLSKWLHKIWSRSELQPGITALCPSVTSHSKICGREMARQCKNTHLLYIQILATGREARVKELMAAKGMVQPVNFPSWCDFFSLVLLQSPLFSAFAFTSDTSFIFTSLSSPSFPPDHLALCAFSLPILFNFWSRTGHKAVTLKMKKEPQQRKLSFDIIVSCKVGRSHQGWAMKLWRAAMSSRRRQEPLVPPWGLKTMLLVLWSPL